MTSQEGRGIQDNGEWKSGGHRCVRVAGSTADVWGGQQLAYTYTDAHAYAHARRLKKEGKLDGVDGGGKCRIVVSLAFSD